MRVLIFGTGQFYEKHKEIFNEMSIVAFVDNSVEKIGKDFYGYQIISPTAISNYEYDKVFIMSMYEDEIEKQLILLGISKDKIGTYMEACMLTNKNEMKVYYRGINNKGSSRKVLLISHELALTGAPIVLFDAAKAIKENGDVPIVISPKEGVLVEELLKEEITVIIDRFISLKNKVLMNLVDQSDMIIVNTLMWNKLIEELGNIEKPIIWWIHEGDFLFSIKGKYLPSKLEDNIYTYAVSNYSKTIMQKYVPEIKICNLTYGIKDVAKKRENIFKEKVVFAMIGVISERKAQDIYIKAIENMLPEDRTRAEFLIIGMEPEYMSEDFIQKIKKGKNISEIKFLGEKSRAEMRELYQQIDVVVCVSRDDPMPVVLAEGMMYGKPCICSSRTGTADFIDGNNGFVIQVEDHEALADKMKWMIHNKEQLPKMGQAARNTYKTHFDYNVFKKKIIREIDNIIANNQ